MDSLLKSGDSLIALEGELLPENNPNLGRRLVKLKPSPKSGGSFPAPPPPHSHTPHSHSPHSHNPHSHNPHSHTPHAHHAHTPHSHAQHSHSPHSHSPHSHFTASPTVQEI